MNAIKQDLLSEEALELFLKETKDLLHQHNQMPKTELDAHKRKMAKAEQQIANLMSAIKAGIITPSTKAELERAEAEQAQAKAALEASSGHLKC